MNFLTNIPKLPMVLVGLASILLVAFVYGYPLLFPYIEVSHPDHFEENVAAAMADEDCDRALRIAPRAVSRERASASARTAQNRAMAYTVYGRTLMECGKPEEGLEQLVQAVNVERESGDPQGQTRRPFYFAPARLTLGEYYLEQDELRNALDHFELARAYAAPADVPYRDYHAAMYRAYSTGGLWARALQFGAPSDEELDRLDNAGLVRLAHVCEGERNWELAGRVGARLVGREGVAAEGHYLLGRAGLAEEENEAAQDHLEQALSNGHAHAAYFLGTALGKSGQPARAIQAFLRTPSGDVYRPFALAKALTLVADGPADAVTRQEILNQLDQEVASMRQLKPPELFDRYRRLTPVAVVTSEAHFASGGPFPVLILWDDPKAPAADQTQVSLSVPDADHDHMLLRRANSILQLQWVENQVNWDSVECLAAGTAAVPGWIDTARDWFGLRPDHAARIEQDENGNSFLSISKLTWFYSVPVPVQDGVGYLLAGRVKGPAGKGGVGWQCLDRAERVLSEGTLSVHDNSDGWTWQGGYLRSQLHWDSIRIQLNALPRAGSVAYDDVMLVEILEPDPGIFD